MGLSNAHLGKALPLGHRLATARHAEMQRLPLRLACHSPKRERSKRCLNRTALSRRYQGFESPWGRRRTVDARGRARRRARSRLGANRASKGSRHLVCGVPRMFLNDLVQGLCKNRCGGRCRDDAASESAVASRATTDPIRRGLAKCALLTRSEKPRNPCRLQLALFRH
jgi:hypothetical protein